MCEGWSRTDVTLSQRCSLQKLLGYQEIRHECKVSCVIFKVSTFYQLQKSHLVIFILTFLSWHKDNVTVVSSKSELLSRPCPKLSPSSKRKLRLEERKEGRKTKVVIMITESLFYFF